jgi:hypothetical protein
VAPRGLGGSSSHKELDGVFADCDATAGKPAAALSLDDDEWMNKCKTSVQLAYHLPVTKRVLGLRVGASRRRRSATRNIIGVTTNI